MLKHILPLGQEYDQEDSYNRNIASKMGVDGPFEHETLYHVVDHCGYVVATRNLGKCTISPT